MMSDMSIAVIYHTFSLTVLYVPILSPVYSKHKCWSQGGSV